VTDTALANASQKRDLLAAEINSLAQRMDELKRELAKIDAWISQWHEFADVGTLAATEAPDSASMFGSVSGGSERKKRRAVGNPKKEEVAEAARSIIQERGEPVSRADLFKALVARGIVISSETDPEMVLSTMLWRTRNLIVRLKTGGYWLQERPWPLAGYIPSSHSDEDYLTTMAHDEQSAAFGGMKLEE
jgi:hypothetical protein